jgi:homoaconitase/3-isopropylmalate dehydratase large subunit
MSARGTSWSRDEISVVPPGTRYADVIDIDVTHIEPQVACPPTVGNVKAIDAAAGMRLQIVPASRGIYLEALHEGLCEILHTAGADIALMKIVADVTAPGRRGNSGGSTQDRQ